jgi:hypothetical protein
MRQRDIAAVGIRPIVRQLEIPDHRERLGRERFDHLDHVETVDAELGPV